MFKANIEAVVSRLENLTTTRTVIGQPMVSGDVTIMPIVSATFGFGLGSGEDPGTVKGGGAGGGIRPVALVVLQEAEV